MVEQVPYIQQVPVPVQQPVPVIQPLPYIEPVPVVEAIPVAPPPQAPVLVEPIMPTPVYQPGMDLIPMRRRPRGERLRSYSAGHLPMRGNMNPMGSSTTIRFETGDIYIGQVDETGTPHGEGVYTWADGSRYTGTWVAGFKDGFGVYEDNIGYRYEGGWRHSEKSGFGTESGFNYDGKKYVYEGGFLNNQRHGVGWKNGYKVKYKFGKRDDDCIIM
jgi:hypothetical protein